MYQHQAQVGPGGRLNGVHRRHGPGVPLGGIGPPTGGLRKPDGGVGLRSGGGIGQAGPVGQIGGVGRLHLTQPMLYYVRTVERTNVDSKKCIDAA